MIPDVITDVIRNGVELEVAAPMAVMIGVMIRFYFGHTFFSVQHAPVWNKLRQITFPLVNIATKRFLDEQLPAVATPEEYVGTIEEDWHSVAKKMSQIRRFEVPLLAGYKTDWKDRMEVGTMVSYHGSKPFAAAPNWLRSRQVHVTFFTDENEMTVVTAHEEANSYRPDLWFEHLLGVNMDVEKGVKMARDTIEEHGELTFHE